MTALTGTERSLAYRRRNGARPWAGRAPQPLCMHCGRRIVGIPAGWKHENDNRQMADDGHEAEPRSIA